MLGASRDISFIRGSPNYYYIPKQARPGSSLRAQGTAAQQSQVGALVHSARCNMGLCKEGVHWKLLWETTIVFEIMRAALLYPPSFTLMQCIFGSVSTTRSDLSRLESIWN